MFRPVFATLLLSFFLATPTFAKEDPSPLLAQAFVPQEAPSPLSDIVFGDENNSANHKLSEFRTHWVLLNLWSTHCAPCIQEMASLDKLQDKMGTALVVLPIAIESHGDVTVPSFYKRHEITHLQTAFDMFGTTPIKLGGIGLPTSILINPQGQDVGRVIGAIQWDKPENVDFLLKKINTKS